MKSKVYLGINLSHNSSAALMIDEVIICTQEERFTNKKIFRLSKKIN